MFHTRLAITCEPAYQEILLAELSEAGFVTFLETADGIEAYAEGVEFDKALTDEILSRYSSLTTLTIDWSQIEKRNWNAEWEANYEPIVVEDTCLIRADFHIPEKQYPYELIITPKMSFGTGHHQTTYLMVQAQLSIPFEGKRVMDAGCGTGILAIMAAKLGATFVDAFDIDAWSVTNGEENKLLNGTSNIRIRQGTIESLEFDGVFDIILANINKNILLSEMPQYAAHLETGGRLLLSGFYVQDIPDLQAAAEAHGMAYQTHWQRDNWASLLVLKSEKV